MADVRRAVAETVSLPSGYLLHFGGSFENLQEASARLAVIVPLALLLIFTMLYTAFLSVRTAGIIFLNVPLAATGGSSRSTSGAFLSAFRPGWASSRYSGSPC